MNYEEEQEMEIEALTSIFEEGKEFERCSPTEFKLKLVPNPAGEGDNHVAVTLHVTYTATYPEEAPEWELENVVMPDEKAAELKEKVHETVESSIGMAMVYTMAETCQDYLREHNVKALSMHEEMMLRHGGDEEDEEEDSGDGEDEEEEEWKGLKDKVLCEASDRITVDSFLVWKAKFDLELISMGVLKAYEDKGKSGKVIFVEVEQAEKTAGAIAGAAGDAKNPGGAATVYNAALFGEVDDEDLDDLDDDDEE